jgi:hypothetical protein
MNLNLALALNATIQAYEALVSDRKLLYYDAVHNTLILTSGGFSFLTFDYKILPGLLSISPIPELIQGLLL